MLKLLAQLKDENLISELTYQFAKFIDSKQHSKGYTEQQKNLAILLAALTSFTVAQGHSCLKLTSNLAQNPFNLSGKYAHFTQAILQKIEQISPLVWPEVLSQHIAFSQDPQHIAPMLFQHQRLYFYRYWQAENQIANYLLQAVSSTENIANTALHKQILEQFFNEESQIDWQKIAVATALEKTFSVISGGPGTGKTRTVALLLAALQLKQIKQQLPTLQIALVAPTGKAAARLKESIAKNLSALTQIPYLSQMIPTQASTIHSLIGITPYREQPKHHKENPLHIDLIVVDEASMIDLFLMNKLLNALKPTTRVILLGDKDQLAAVEAGNIMGELGKFLQYGYSQSHSDYLIETTGYVIPTIYPQVPAICDSLSHLRKSFRFNEKSGIGQLSAEINGKQAVRSWQLFTNTTFQDIHLVHYPAHTEFSDHYQHLQYCVKQVVEYALIFYQDYLMLVKQRQQTPNQVSISQIFAAFQKVRFLSALRVSELGVERLNQSIAEALLDKGLIHFRTSRENYLGKPILITENAPQLNIFSGDIGLVLSDEQGNTRIYFETETQEKPLSIVPSRAPANEPAYAMTVHKSQGSEFEHTLLVMPLQSSAIVTKELLYTAVTRAKNHFTLFSTEKVWKQGVKSEIERQSGLTEQILAVA